MRSTRPEHLRKFFTTATFGPDLSDLLSVIDELGMTGLISRDRPTLVALRFTGQQRGSRPGVPASAWNDCLGVLAPRETPERWEWVSGRGTADPGREAIERTGGVAVHPAGCARILPGLYQRSHGGGFHKWDRERPAYRQVRPLVGIDGQLGTERWDGESWETEVTPVGGANWHALPVNTTVKRALERGIWHYSQACPVTLNRDVHDEMRAVGGWTEEIDGCSLDLLVIDWGGPLSRPYIPGD